MAHHDAKNFISFAQELAEQSGAILGNAFSHTRSFETKDDQSPVTEIDQQIERALRASIAARFPHHGILGEEYGSEALDNDLVWVIDPIDGTKAFISGYPVFGTLIALTYRGKPILGVIDNPVTHERWLGANGHPTTLNGKVIKTRQHLTLEGALLTNGNPDSLSKEEYQAFTRVKQNAAWCIYGGSCQAYGRVADGSLDIALDSGLDPFDYCALVPIIEGAGGCITDWEGHPLTLHSKHRCVASTNPTLHEKVLEKLKG